MQLLLHYSPVLLVLGILATTVICLKGCRKNPSFYISGVLFTLLMSLGEFWILYRVAEPASYESLAELEAVSTRFTGSIVLTQTKLRQGKILHFKDYSGRKFPLNGASYDKELTRFTVSRELAGKEAHAYLLHDRFLVSVYESNKSIIYSGIPVKKDAGVYIFSSLLGLALIVFSTILGRTKREYA